MKSSLILCPGKCQPSQVPACQEEKNNLAILSMNIYLIPDSLCSEGAQGRRIPIPHDACILTREQTNR